MSKTKLLAVAAAAAAGMIASVIQVEGGYVNHPNDPGGETNKGITKKVAVAHGYTGPMRTIPHAVVESIYYQDYLVAPGYLPLLELDDSVTEELFDTTVNMGSARPSRFFQQSLNEICPALKVSVDGKVGPATIAGFRRCQRILLCQAMLPRLDGKQRAEYDRLVRVNPRLKVFHRGWINQRIGNVPVARCT